MRCDDVPRLLTTAGPIGRWRARRHSARCPRCAAFLPIVEALADIPPLPDSHRALWARAADEAVTVKLTWPRLVRPALVGLAAAIVGLVALRVALNPVPPAPVKVAPGVEEWTIASAKATIRSLTATVLSLDAMQDALDPLAEELADLRRHAELLDARRDADRLLAAYAWPERPHGL
jgi:hypothetical protein